MNKTRAVVVVVLVLGAITGIIVFRSGPQAQPRTPEQVVLRCFDCLRDADFDGLRKCYTKRAWEIVAKSLPSADDSGAIKGLKEYMAGLGGFRIENTTYRGGTADVEVVIEGRQGDEREVLHLVQSGDTWLID